MPGVGPHFGEGQCDDPHCPCHPVSDENRDPPPAKSMIMDREIMPESQRQEEKRIFDQWYNDLQKAYDQAKDHTRRES